MGFGFMAHGWAKLSRGPAGFEKLLIQTGVPFPHITSWLVPFIEMFGGLAILVGAFVLLISIPLIGTMLVAMFTIQINYGFSSVKTIGLTTHGPLFGPPGYEINLLYIAGLISLMLTGAGIFSIDHLINSRQRK
jgi:putative oxidoreductase